MKLFIGTAQFGFKYGFNKIKIKKLEKKKYRKNFKKKLIKKL